MNGESALNMLTGAALSTAGNIASSKLDFDQTRELMDLQRQWQVLSWNRQNEYNEAMYNKYASPSAMVSQYKEAGLNPAALAGTQPNQSVSNSSPADTPSPGYRGKYDLGGSAISGAQLALSIARQEAEIDNIEANTKNVESQTNERDSLLTYRKDLLMAQGVSERNQARISAVTADIEEFIKEDTIENKKVLFESAVESLQALKLNNTRSEFDNSKLSEKYDLWYSECIAQLGLYSVQQQLGLSEISVNNAEVRKLMSDVAVNRVLSGKLLIEATTGQISNEILKDRLAAELELSGAQKDYYQVKSSEVLNYGSTGLGLLINLLGLGILAKSQGVFQPPRRKIGF